jgi:hypothetical protein
MQGRGKRGKRGEERRTIGTREGGKGKLGNGFKWRPRVRGEEELNWLGEIVGDFGWRLHHLVVDFLARLDIDDADSSQERSVDGHALFQRKRKKIWANDRRGQEQGEERQ